MPFFAGIAQLVECQPSKLNVASSSLVARSSHNIAVWCNGSTRDSGSLSLGSSPGTATINSQQSVFTGCFFCPIVAFMNVFLNFPSFFSIFFFILENIPIFAQN